MNANRLPYADLPLRPELQGFFVGQLMKQTGGKADPKLANQILNQMLKG